MRLVLGLALRYAVIAPLSGISESAAGKIMKASLLLYIHEFRKAAEVSFQSILEPNTHAGSG